MNEFEEILKKQEDLKDGKYKPVFDKEETSKRDMLTRQFKKYRDGKGKLDAKKFLEDNMELILMDLINPNGRGINAKKSEMILKIMDIYKEKQEVNVNLAYSPSEIARDADQIIGYLRQQLKEIGVCPLLNKPCLLLTEVCDN